MQPSLEAPPPQLCGRGGQFPLPLGGAPVLTLESGQGGRDQDNWARGSWACRQALRVLHVLTGEQGAGSVSEPPEDDSGTRDRVSWASESLLKGDLGG